MALFKSLRGKRENLPSTKTDGYAYFCTNDGTFWIDYKDENGVVQRKQINAKDAETLMGASLSTILSSSEVEIPTSKAILDALGGKVDKISGKGLSTNDYTTTEKNKLAGIEAGANNYSLPVATSTSLGGVKSGTDITVDSSGNVSVNDDSHNHIISNIDNLQSTLDSKVDFVDGKGLSTNDYTTAEKNKLAGIDTGANKTIVDSALSSTSTNPVQNKVVNTALAGKANSSHTHSYLPLSGGTLSGNLTLQKSMYITSESGTRAILFQNSGGKQHNIALVGNDGLQDIAFRIINDNNTDDKKYVFAYNDVTDTIVMRPAVSCGTSLSVSGNITGQYINGTWLQTTEATDLGKTAGKVAVLDGSGWVYYRTPAELKTDMGVVTPADYVVERGTSSSWHYEKWNSGKLELWRQMTSSNMGTTGQVGGWYYRVYKIALPSNLLKSVQDVQCNCHWGDGVSFASGHADTANFNATYFSNKNGGAGTFWHKVIGTWK